MTFARAIAPGFVVGAALAVVALARIPGTTLPRVAPITTTAESGEIIESFFVEAPADGIAITHSGKLPLGVLPASAPRFTEPAIERGLALLVKVRNARGEVIGFASELALTAKDDVARNRVGVGDWTVVLPGRGALFLHQDAPGRGVVVGGTGELAGAKGALVAIDDRTKATPEGALAGKLELRVVGGRAQ